ncbi:MAG: glycoside hydrolase family 3 protein [Parachlamydiales bacterium]
MAVGSVIASSAGAHCSLRPVADLLKVMSVEEKVGQLFIAHFHGEAANKEAETLVQGAKIGGIIYYNWSNGLSSPQQVHTLSCGLQELTMHNPNPIPLLIAGDQEGGIVARFKSGFTEFPGNGALGQTNDLDLVEDVALAMGKELRAVGVNMNLAPVVDVNSNPRNAIGIRSYGDQPQTVTDHGRRTLQGYQKTGVMTVLKHWVALCDSEVDSHLDQPICSKPLEVLREVHMRPFAELAPLTDGIMSAHSLVPALDAEYCSTVSKKSMDYLRDVVGFDGVVMTDSLVMKGVLKGDLSIEEVAVRALEAGCTILLFGGKALVGTVEKELGPEDILRIHQYIVDAVRLGRISMELLDRNVEKVLKLKERRIDSLLPSVELGGLSEAVCTPAHQELAMRAASLALRIISVEPSCLKGLFDRKVCVVSPLLLKENIDKTPLLMISHSTIARFVDGLNPSESEAGAVQEFARESEVLLVFSYNAWKNPQQEALIRSLLETGKPFILIVVRDPVDATLFPTAHLTLMTYSPSVPSIQAVYQRLRQEYTL